MEISGVRNCVMCSHQEIKNVRSIYQGAADISYGVNFGLCQYGIVTYYLTLSF